MGVRSPRKAWAVLRQRANTLRILDACEPLWACMNVCILVDSDNLQGLDYQNRALLFPPKYTELMEKRFRI